MTMRADYIWMNGEVMPWDQATVHVFAHALHYGSSAFEGIRAYEINGTPHLFRAREHYERLLFSCKVARMESPLDVDGWIDVTKQVLRANKLAGAYVRPLVFRGYDSLGVDGRGCPIDAILGAVPWGQVPGRGGHRTGGGRPGVQLAPHVLQQLQPHGQDWRPVRQ